MNKQDLVAAVAAGADISKTAAGLAIDALTDAVKGALARGEEVNIIGFGKFFSAEQAARTGRNPRTGEAIQIKASKLPKFKAGKELKDAVN
ncbi:MAG: HU family DNA-binding protein [Alphaproteobacteria bacterium]|jgi:DNA-binding protein HU-beta|nr:HU family DNA-binding protein [Alphaproteobacteria bacterium]